MRLERSPSGQEVLMKKFRNLFRISLLSFIIGGCCSAHVVEDSVKTPATQEETRRADIEELRQSTVALVDKSLGVIIPVCTGVWIEKNTILTAAHCVEDSPVASYTTLDGYNKDETKTAILVGYDKKVDLALLYTISSDDHPVAIISKNEVATGDPLHIIGHPVGYAWTYMSGEISAVRSDFGGPSGKIEKVIQISAPVWMGVSGGGAFNAQGQLIGICSWVSKNGPNLAFFIHKDVVQEFIKRQKNQL